jgi:signal peptidase II
MCYNLNGDNMVKNISIISLIIFIFDQLIKLYVYQNLIKINVIDNFFSLVYAENYGVAFSMLWGGRYIIILISAILIFLLFYFIRKDYILKGIDNNLKNIMYGFLIGGVLGNLLDRVLRGFVIDYICLNIFGYSFPVFNLADIFIVLGVRLMFFDAIIDVKTKNSKEEKNVI